jgi:hypothetical protein
VFVVAVVYVLQEILVSLEIDSKYGLFVQYFIMFAILRWLDFSSVLHNSALENFIQFESSLVSFGSRAFGLFGKIEIM